MNDDARRSQTDAASHGADWLLRAYLGSVPGVEFAATHSDGRAIVDLLYVPEAQRRRRIGTRIYLMWEASLPPGTEVHLFAIDAEASSFWRTLGFAGEDNSQMSKTVAAIALAA